MTINCGKKGMKRFRLVETLAKARGCYPKYQRWKIVPMYKFESVKNKYE